MMLLKLSDIEDIEKPIELLPQQEGGGIKDEKVRRLVMVMYSLESFLYKQVNKASKDEDFSKIDNLGAYAVLLQIILTGANPTINIGERFIFQTRAAGFEVLRGVQMSDEELQKYKNLAPPKNCFVWLMKNLGCWWYSKKVMKGYSSTSLKQE